MAPLNVCWWIWKADFDVELDFRFRADGVKDRVEIDGDLLRFGMEYFLKQRTPPFAVTYPHQ
jgi:hypothetical protein